MVGPSLDLFVYGLDARCIGGSQTRRVVGGLSDAAAAGARAELADRAGEPDGELRELAGLPDAAAGAAMLAALDSVVWSKRLAAA